MNTYFNESKKECRVTLTDTVKIDEWTTVVDLKKLKEALKALEMLGKEVCSITLTNSVFIDMDTKYYKRFSDDFMNRLFEHYARDYTFSDDLIYKNNRLYITFEGKEIILPIDMKERYFDRAELTLTVKYK